VVAHITQAFRNRWWGLFACYESAGLPHTNNEMETFLRRLKLDNDGSPVARMSMISSCAMALCGFSRRH